MEISNRTVGLLLATILLLGLIPSTSAYDFYVGGKDGWVRNPSESFNHWAGRLRFQVHDRLVFNYAKDEDSVLEVSKEGYDSCNVSVAIKKVDSTFELDRSGDFYFIGGATGSCDSGQKLQVVVMADRKKPTPTTPPSSSPSPPSPSPSSVSPSVSPSPSSQSPSPSSVSPSVSPSSSSPSSYSVSPSVSPSPSSYSLSPSLSPTSSPSPYSASPSLSPSPSSTSASPSPSSYSLSPSVPPSSSSPSASPPSPSSPNAKSPSPAVTTSPAPSPSEDNQSSASTVPSFSVGLLVLLLATAAVLN